MKDLSIIRDQVAAVVVQEAENVKPAEVEVVIDSKFVLDCLDTEELGDGLLYAALHKKQFVYAKGSECWYVWDEHIWRPDDMDQAIAAVENVALRYAAEIEVQGAALSEAMRDPSDGGKAQAERIKVRIGQLAARVKRLRKDKGRKNCLAFAHTNPKLPLAVRAADFDLNPWLLACANGVINLKDGVLHPGKQEDYISKRARGKFLGTEVDFKDLTKVLLDIYSHDEEMVLYLRRLFGYSLYGDRQRDHVFPVMVGRGRNGKTKIAEAIIHTLGDYAAPVPAELLLDNRAQSANATDPVLLSLKGLRLAVASETAEGRKFAAEKVKWLTGGDTITARGLYDKKPVKFLPSHMLVLLTNHPPNAPGTDTAFWERCRLIQHKLSFVVREDGVPLKPYEREADPKIPEKLLAMADTILSWLVLGCIEWNTQGLLPPKSVRNDTKEYQEAENDIGQFIEEACHQGSGCKIHSTELYEAYCHWYKATINDKDKFRPGQRTFGSRLGAMDMFEKKKSHGAYFYMGITVSDEYLAKIEADKLKNKHSWSSVG